MVGPWVTGTSKSCGSIDDAPCQALGCDRWRRRIIARRARGRSERAGIRKFTSRLRDAPLNRGGPRDVKERRQAVSDSWLCGGDVRGAVNTGRGELLNRAR